MLAVGSYLEELPMSAESSSMPSVDVSQIISAKEDGKVILTFGAQSGAAIRLRMDTSLIISALKSVDVIGPEHDPFPSGLMWAGVRRRDRSLIFNFKLAGKTTTLMLEASQVSDAWEADKEVGGMCQVTSA